MKKKILSALLAAAMVLTSCLPVFAEGEVQPQPTPETPAVVNEVVEEFCECGLTKGHEGECQKAAEEFCECGLAKGHEGECQKAAEEFCECGLAKGHEGECQKAAEEFCDCGLAKGHEGECQKAAEEFCECGLAKGHEGECQKAADAPICATCNANPCVCDTVAPMDAEKAEELFKKVMKADTLSQLEEIVADMTEEDGASFLAAIGEEKTMAFVEHLETLVRATIPEKEVIKNPDTEIITPAVNNTNVAPFGEPVEGKAVKRLLRTLAAPIAEEETTPDNGLEVNKEVSGPDENGIYTLTLEAWATGEKTIIETEEAIPTDIILVLDQSGSMAYDFTVPIGGYTEFNSENPEDHYQQQLNSLYVKVGDDYFPVTVKKSTTLTNPTHYPGKKDYIYQIYQKKLYHKCSDDTYGKINCHWLVVSIYVCESCGEISLSLWDGPDNSDEFYIADSATTTYTFSYVNKDGNTITTDPSTSVPEGWEFYIDGGTSKSTRLEALQNAVRTFTKNVNDKAAGTDGMLGTKDDVNHRVAIVGFASPAGNGDNSEVLTLSGNNSGSVGVSYAELAKDNDKYNGALQDMSTTSGQDMVTKAINALAAEGATRVDLGMEMANKILEKHPLESGEKRNRVIVVFTDGVPTTSNSYSETVAQSAIAYGKTAKSTYGATVYTVGIFDGADSSKDGNANGNETQKANWFMQRLSSNTTYPQTPSYYLSANNAATLNQIFKNISDNIETGGSSTTLGTSAVVKDVITEQFELPKGATTSNIKVYTANYTAANTFDDKQPFATTVNGVNTVTISEDGKTISVTNFNYAENWVGTETAADGKVTYRGKKLIIEIPIKVREGFLGGNGVLTNAPGSGVYENATATEPLEKFVSPAVDVEIERVTIEAPDMNVYLLSGVTNEQLKAALTVKVGNVILDMNAPNYGLQPWQNAYVEIENTGTAFNGAYNGLVNDTTYTVQIKVEPTNEGTVTEKTGGPVNGNIYVFKPEITFQDSQINLGETPNYARDNFVEAKWKHGDDYAPGSMGSAPTLSYEYVTKPAQADFKTDTPVKVTVKIGTTDVTSNVTFYRAACDFNACEHKEKKIVEASKDDRINFVVHINSFDLTITKELAKDTSAPADQTFIFKVTGPNSFEMEVVIPQSGSVTIKGLPVGTYTVTEDTAWSWRYILMGDNGIKVEPEDVVGSNGVVEVTFTNKLKRNNWLSGTSYANNKFVSGQKPQRVESND